MDNKSKIILADNTEISLYSYSVGNYGHFIFILEDITFTEAAIAFSNKENTSEIRVNVFNQQEFTIQNYTNLAFISVEAGNKIRVALGKESEEENDRTDN